MQCARWGVTGKIGHAGRDDLYGGISRRGRVAGSRAGDAGAWHYRDWAPADQHASARSGAPGAARLAAGGGGVVEVMGSRFGCTRLRTRTGAAEEGDQKESAQRNDDEKRGSVVEG